MSRFDFIRFRDRKLYDLCIQVEERIDDSQDVFTLKCRRALEYIISLTGAKGKNLYERILDIKNNLAISSNIQREFLILKDICNENIHIDYSSQKNIDVYEVIKKLELICHWLIDAIAKKKIDVKIEANLKELENLTSDLKKAFKQNDYNTIIKLNDKIKNLAQSQADEINSIKRYSDTISIRETEARVKKDLYNLLNNLNAYIKNGYPDSMQGDIDELKEDIELALNGETVGLYDIGNLYRYEESDFPFFNSNCTTAIDYLELAAYKGDTDAQSLLGELYYEDRYEIDDFEKAYYWSIIAAENGDEVSQFRIGQMYYYGEGVDQDFQKALEWYNKAESNGHPYANRAITNIRKKSGYSTD